MSQQPATEQVPNAIRRSVLVFVLFAVAWMVFALCYPNRLGFALGGGTLVLTGVLALLWRREMWAYHMRITPRFQRPFYSRYYVVAWGLMSLLLGVVLLISAAVR